MYLYVKQALNLFSRELSEVKAQYGFFLSCNGISLPPSLRRSYLQSIFYLSECFQWPFATIHTSLLHSLVTS